MPAQAQENERRTLQFRKFSGVNLTDARTAIEDDEFYWLENAMPVGGGNLKLVPAQAASIATLAQGIASLWGFTLGTTPYLYAVGNDGSLTQIKSDGTVTVVGAAAVVTASAHLAMWKNTHVLIVDPTKGYLSWDGGVLTSIDAAKVGNAIAVFEGRVWLANGRTITYSAPTSYTDFTGASGGGSTILTDEAFPGTITNLLSALEQLWIVGPGAVDAISNVQTSGATTTFSITNVVTNVGSPFPLSVTSFFRTVLFLTPYGVYAIVGATPQKLSDKLDGLFPLLTLGTDQPAAIGTIYNVFVWCVLVTYNDPVAGARPLLLCFTEKKWFFASQGSLTGIASLLATSGQPQVWGTDGTHIFQLFGASSSTTVTYSIKSKLYDFGQAVQWKHLHRIGLEFSSPQTLAPAITVETETSSIAPAFSNTNLLVWIDGTGAVLIFTNNAAAALGWIAQGLILANQQAPVVGRYLGWDLAGTDAPWVLARVSMDIQPTERAW